MLSMYPIGNDLYSGRRSLNIIGLRKVWFGIALLLILASLMSILIRDPNLGIEFRGGSQFTVTGTEVTSHQPAYEAISKIGADDAPRVSSLGTSGLRVQTVELSDQQTQELKETLAAAYKVPVSDVTSTYIGPSWGQNIMSKAIRAMIVFMVTVSLVLMLYFRSWTIAIGAMGALLHDFIITLGVYWLLGLEITPATIIGILTILGYSLYDTVVVFDKIRENT
ncbi:protein translocase subunit SecF, partial [uncultured Arcanobacterium sp.]|uniref:protein translocase subunit SecF n=1 Tax=uncultured Arcanobacterium sp. TaxID=487520 RepID=UPI00263394D0